MNVIVTKPVDDEFAGETFAVAPVPLEMLTRFDDCICQLIFASLGRVPDKVNDILLPTQTVFDAEETSGV